ncbi:MAG: archaea-specific SMC-related protein [Halobacteriales archaeon]|nr:archaea-specific SMC-related protein [Halobacteriales archaeon]
MTWHFDIENIAGIRSGTATIEPGVNTVQASNWQGKSSLIKAIETSMGTAEPLTEGATRGRVELQTAAGETVTELRRDDGETIVREGQFLADEQDRVCAELFAFLDGDNAIRRAVRNGDNLESILTRPLDFERIDERIADLQHERRQVEAELESARTAAKELPAVQERVTSLEAELEQLETERSELADESADNRTTPASEELSEARAERDRLADREEQLETTIANTRERLEDRKAELDQLDIPEETDIESELAEVRETVTEIERDVELLQSVYTANKRVLDEDRIDLLTEIERGLMEDSVACWVCGSDVDRETIRERLAALGDRITSEQKQATQYREQIEELESRRETVREKQRRQRDLQEQVNDLEMTLADREESLTTVREQLADVDERIEALTETVDETNDRLTDLESEIKYTRAELEDARDELASLEATADRRETLEAELDSLRDEIETLRTRKERLKTETREAFDDAMATVIDQLTPGFETARLTPNFDLVVARDGREASLDALSEGEVELLGIVAAIAGYEAFDVTDRVPVILLDSVGGLASDNLRAIVTYLSDRTRYLVTTAYPEQGSFDGHVIDPAEWSVVSDDMGSEITP